MQAFVLWLSLATAVFLYMSLWYGLALRYRRLDVVDVAWGMGFIYVAWLGFFIAGRMEWWQLLAVVLVTIWGARLSVHIALRNLGKPEDRRYTEMRQKWGRWGKLKAFGNVFLLQGVLILLVSTPAVAIMMSHGPVNPGVVVGFVVWMAGIAYEAIADGQLSRFLRDRAKGSHAIMQSGLWRYSRHPNYFGEVVTWWGAAVVAISLGRWWGVLGALVITFLITKISGLPPLEKHYAGKPEYEDYKKRTPVLVPWSGKP